MTTDQTEIQKSDSIVLADIYNDYPYRKNPENKKTHQSLYVKQEDETDHKFSVDWYLFKKIVTTYYKYVTAYLTTGKVYRFAAAIGDLRLYKWERKKKRYDLDRIIKKIVEVEGISYNEAKYKVSDYLEEYPYKERKEEWLIGWSIKRTPFKYCKMWYFRMSKPKWTKLNKELRKKSNTMMKLTRTYSWKDL